MKLTKQTLKRIIKEELEAVMNEQDLDEGFMDSVKGFFGGKDKERVNLRPAEPMATKGRLSRPFRDPKPVFDSLQQDYPFIEVTEQYAFIPARIFDMGPGGMEGDGPMMEIEYAIEDYALKKVDVQTPEAGVRYYFMHRGK